MSNFLLPASATKLSHRTLFCQIPWSQWLKISGAKIRIRVICPPKLKNDRNGSKWQSGISKSLAEYFQRPVCFINVQTSLHENIVFSFCALMDNAAHIIFIMWISISGLEPWYHFRFNISCGVAVTVRRL